MKPQSSQGSTRLNPTQSQTSHGNLSSDYNYSREESMINRMDPPAKPISAAKKRLVHRQSGTIAVDKQAYKPPVDEEEDDDDWSEDEKGHRRKRVKGGVTQKKLDHLPMVGAQAKHRRRRKGKNGQDEGSESESLVRTLAVGIEFPSLKLEISILVIQEFALCEAPYLLYRTRLTAQDMPVTPPSRWTTPKSTMRMNTASLTLKPIQANPHFPLVDS
jgi:hypothetical protein